MAGNVKDQAERIRAHAQRPAAENPFTRTDAVAPKSQDAKAPKRQNVKISLYLDPDLAAALDDAWMAARRSGERLSRSEYIERLLRGALEL